MTSLVVTILLIVQSLLIFLFAGYEYLTLMHFPSLPIDSKETVGLVSVSIILPVRNQASTVESCVKSLVELEYPSKEIMVVDGHSTDGTKEILTNFQTQITVIEEDSLPVGWVGKNWACHQGFKKSKGEALLFTDGDSVHARNSLARTVGYLKTNDVDIVTIAPGTVLKSFWEKLLQPPIFWLIMLLVGGKQVNDDKRPNAIGNGQYMLFRREVYERIGGHFAVKDKIVEDYALARLAKQAGYRLRFLTAKDAVAVRMYDSFPSIWKGWRKNFYTVSEKRMFWKAMTRSVLMFIFLFLPFVILAYGILLIPANPLNPYLLAGAFMAFWLWLGIIVLDRSIDISAVYALLFPFAILIYIGIGIDATLRGALGLGFQWKGRVYGKPIERELETSIM